MTAVDPPTRWPLTLVALFTLLPGAATQADIYRWDTGEVIPGTEGIEPGPGVKLDGMDLEYANLQGRDVTAANFEESSLRHAHLAGTNFTTANLTRARLDHADMLNADLSNASLAEANLSFANLRAANVAGTDLTGATIAGTSFYWVDTPGLTKEQLYSTASYQERNLQDIDLGRSNLRGWDLSGQNLAGANLGSSAVNNANFTGANLAFARLDSVFLMGANLTQANLTSAELYGTRLANVDFTGAEITGSRLTADGFTRDQLYSTASYQNKNLRGIHLSSDLSGWDLGGQDLTGAILNTRLTNANLKGANLKNAVLETWNPQDALTDSTTIYNQWTVFSRHFDPVAAGLTLVPSEVGDFDADDEWTDADVNMLAFAIRTGEPKPDQLPITAFDLNDDTLVNLEDHRIWVKDLKHTWFGDANLDGEFNSSDMVQAFAAGWYERRPSTTLHWWWGDFLRAVGWAEGDWNGDGLFDSSDMVVAFVDGGYERGPRMDAVPEPGAWLLSMAALFLWIVARRSRCSV